MLTFGEAIAAARNLEGQLNSMLKRWTWPDVTLTIFERRPGYVRYEVRRQGEYVGIATVMPFISEGEKLGPEGMPEARRKANGTEGG